jgi:DNA replication factor GINS
MDLNYDELRRIYRLEKNTSKLVEVEEDFYEAISDFVQREKKEYLASLKNFSSAKARNFANLKKIVEEIFSLREKKLLSRALIASRNGGEESGKIALQEKKTFKELLAVLNRHRAFLEAAFEPEKRKAGREMVSLRILREVPAFVGPDMREYGPFSVDEAVSLPLKVAELLLARKLAEERK